MSPIHPFLFIALVLAPSFLSSVNTRASPLNFLVVSQETNRVALRAGTRVKREGEEGGAEQPAAVAQPCQQGPVSARLSCLPSAQVSSSLMVAIRPIACPRPPLRTEPPTEAKARRFLSYVPFLKVRKLFSEALQQTTHQTSCLESGTFFLPKPETSKDYSISYTEVHP